MENSLKPISNNLFFKITNLITLLISIAISILAIIFAAKTKTSILIIAVSIFSVINIIAAVFNLTINIINNPNKKSYIVNLKLFEIFYNLFLTSFSCIYFIGFTQNIISWTFFGISYALSFYNLLITSIWTNAPSIIKYITNIITITLLFIFTILYKNILNQNLVLLIMLYSLIYIKEILNIIFNFNKTYNHKTLKIIYKIFQYIEITLLYINLLFAI